MQDLTPIKHLIPRVIIALIAWLGYLAGLNMEGLSVLILAVPAVLGLNSVRKRWRHKTRSKIRL